MSFPKKRIVCIEWEDSASTSGYYNPKEPDNTTTVMCRTVGYMVEKNKKVIKVCTETFEDNEFRYVHSIPKGMVRKITILRETK